MMKFSDVVLQLKEAFSVKPETVEKIKIGIGGLIGGAGIAMVIGFNWGGWSTSSTTQKMNGEAVLASQSAICVAQFTTQPNGQDKLKEFEKIDSYQRSEFIEKGGWDKMPGQKEASSGVSSACVTGIEALTKI
jgi:hypothetical protein